NNLFDQIKDLLLKNKDYVAEDKTLLKAKIISDAYETKKELLELLLSDEKIKQAFFKDVNGVLVFDKKEFVWLIESKEFLPDSYTKYMNNIGLTCNDEYVARNKSVVLDFPFKDCLLVGGQDKDDQKRKEIFFNDILASDQITNLLAPKVFTNIKKYTKDGIENITDFNEEDNLIIKGNNLIVLASLLKRYENKVKCIYIDPPY
ncbi:site-specific DNA-methyltransferase, partial [Ureaplasma diversum]|uniref:site-specific DNA-methyltransferase n=1 Tax=Ureaplasma diversum TaxID=42094 RepID=UPI001E638E9D